MTHQPEFDLGKVLSELSIEKLNQLTARAKRLIKPPALPEADITTAGPLDRAIAKETAGTGVVQTGTGDVLTMRPYAADHPTLLSNEAVKQLQDAWESITPEEAEQYFRNNPLMLLYYPEDYYYLKPPKIDRNNRKRLLEELLQPTQVKDYLREQPLELLRINYSNAPHDQWYPEEFRDVFQQMTIELTPQRVTEELQKNPGALFTLRFKSTFHDEYAPLMSRDAQLAIKEFGKNLTMMEARAIIEKDPKVLLQADLNMIPSPTTRHGDDSPIPAYVRGVIHEEAQKIRFQFNPDAKAAETTEEPTRNLPDEFRGGAKPIDTNRPWEDLMGPGEVLSNRGSTAVVYRPERYPNTVVKVFSKSPRSYAAERHALEVVQESNHVPKTYAFREEGGDNYIVKEYIDGKNIQTSTLVVSKFPLTPKERIQTQGVEASLQQTVAGWVLSSLEALSEFHEKGIMIADFKFADYLWDAIHQRTVINDLNNACDIDRKSQFFREGPLPYHDIRDIMKVFLYATPLGKEIGMKIAISGEILVSDGRGSESPGINKDIAGKLIERAEELGAVPSFIKVLDLLYSSVSNILRPNPSARDYYEAVKAYFTEIGLYKT